MGENFEDEKNTIDLEQRDGQILKKEEEPTPMYFVVYKSNQGEYLVQVGDSSFSKTLVPDRTSAPHSLGEIRQGVATTDTNPQDPRKGVQYICLQNLAPIEPEWELDFSWADGFLPQVRGWKIGDVSIKSSLLVSMSSITPEQKKQGEVFQKEKLRRLIENRLVEIKKQEALLDMVKMGIVPKPKIDIRESDSSTHAYEEWHFPFRYEERDKVWNGRRYFRRGGDNGPESTLEEAITNAIAIDQMWLARFESALGLREKLLCTDFKLSSDGLCARCNLSQFDHPQECGSDQGCGQVLPSRSEVQTELGSEVEKMKAYEELSKRHLSGCQSFMVRAPFPRTDQLVAARIRLEADQRVNNEREKTEQKRLQEERKVKEKEAREQEPERSRIMVEEMIKREFSNCSLCGQEISGNACSKGAYDEAHNLEAVFFPEDGKWPRLKLLVTESGKRVAGFWVVAERNPHEAGNLYYGDVKRSTWMNHPRDSQWWDGETPITELKILGPGEKLPEDISQERKLPLFESVGNRYFRCPSCSKESARLGKSDFASYRDNKAVSIICPSCNSFGIAKSK